MHEKILVVHQGALGDVILSFPALKVMNSQRGAVVDLMCRNRVGEVGCIRGIAENQYDVDSARFCGLFGGAAASELNDFLSNYDRIVLIGMSREMKENLRALYNKKIDWIASRPGPGQTIHVALHVLRGLQSAGLVTSSDFLVKPESPKRDSPLGSQEMKGFILIHPGAGSRRKCWDLGRFIHLARDLEGEGQGTRFLVGPAERDLLRAPNIDLLPEQTRIHQTEDLGEVMVLLNKAECFVGNDSGVGHLAAFMGKPTVTIFGPSDPGRWAPVGSNVTVLRGAASCAPCFETEKRNCTEPLCLSEVTVGMVLGAIRAALR